MFICVAGFVLLGLLFIAIKLSKEFSEIKNNKLYKENDKILNAYKEKLLNTHLAPIFRNRNDIIILKDKE